MDPAEQERKERRVQVGDSIHLNMPPDASTAADKGSKLKGALKLAGTGLLSAALGYGASKYLGGDATDTDTDTSTTIRFEDLLGDQ